MSKKITRKVLVAVFALVLSVVALGTTTYAWFTLGNTVKVDSFDVKVTGGEGLEMTYVTSTGTEKGYVTTISKDQIEEYLKDDYSLDSWEDFELGVVTSVDGKEFKKLSDDGKSLVELDIDEKPFVEFKLKFRTKGTDKKLVWSGVTLDSTGVSWKPEFDYIAVGGAKIVKDTEATYFAKNGTRIAVVPKTEDAKIYELPTSGTNNTALSNGEPNFAEGAHNYYKNATQYDLVTDHSTYKAAPTFSSITAPVDVVDFGSFDSDYYYAEVTVRIYLEGFDSETFNAILSDKIQVALSFELKEK